MHRGIMINMSPLSRKMGATARLALAGECLASLARCCASRCASIPGTLQSRDFPFHQSRRGSCRVSARRGQDLAGT